MKVRIQLLILVLIAVLAFLAGSWATFQGTRPDAAPERKILHYVDPMNPALKFDDPGIAPCGMPREPVYADGLDGDVPGGDLRASLPPGTIRISPDKQQLIGVKTITVEKAPWTHTLRVLGRVTPDETLVYQINAATEGWIETTQPVTTGSQVKENELLATLSFFSLEYRTLVQNYFNLVNLGDVADEGLSPLVNNPQYSEPQLRLMRKAARFAGPIADSSQIDYYRKSLYNYGITPYQLREMERTRTFPELVEIRAPAAGFVLYRNVSPGLRLDRGDEIFRIADLSRVWVLADIFENEAAVFKPGMQVAIELPYRKKTFYGRVSPVLPQFDPATRTLKMRLVVDNPDFILRPDMFVNLEIPMSGPEAIVVPVDAVIDSGLKKTVFVAREGGYFEPRSVATGRHMGERVEIFRGLMAGEKIVVSGNFLIDSEARIQQAASGIIGNIGRDPVCGMNIDEDLAKAEGRFLEYKGKTYYFCEPQCLEDFRMEPERYAGAPPAGIEPAEAHSGHDGMAMPAMQAPAGMAAMPEAPSGMKPESGAGMMPMPGAPDAAPMPGPMEGEHLPGAMPEAAAPPAPGASGPAINLRTERYGSPASAPVRRQQLSRPAPPAAAVPQPGPVDPAHPEAEEMPVPGAPDAAPMPGSMEGEHLSGAMPETAAPPAPETPAPGINLRKQRFGSPGAAQIRRPKIRRPAPPAAAEPSPSLPESGEVLMPGAAEPGPDGVPTPGFENSMPLPETGPGASSATPPEAPR